jgi:hypothetical protein
MQEKKIRRKKNLSSFSENEAQLLERLRKMKEEKKKYIFAMFSKVFTDIMNDDDLLQTLDENKDNKEFQENISKILKEEIIRYENLQDKNIEEFQENSKIEGNNE